MTEILRHLNRKHRHGGSISPSSSHSSLSIESAKSNQATGGGWDDHMLRDTHITLYFPIASAEATAAAKKAQQEMYGALSTKRDEIVDKLEKKLTAYKDLLLKEMVKLISFSLSLAFSYFVFLANNWCTARRINCRRN